MRATKIVATLGLASQTQELIRSLVVAGVDVFRLNMSHGTHQWHAQTIAHIRACSAESARPVAILADLQGPKIRVGDMGDGRVLEKDEEVVLSGVAGIPGVVVVDYPNLHAEVLPGQSILFDDGAMECVVEQIEGQRVICRVVVGGRLLSHKGVNFPHSKLSVSAISSKDREDAAFAVDQGVDYIALSFVRSAQHVLDARIMIDELGHAGMQRPQLIAKIEKGEAIDALHDIVQQADAVMVARGDLAIETEQEMVPVYQRRIIAECYTQKKPVIIATQMLDSMIRAERPTRAEVSDVAHAVFDNVDAVMLSGETASGDYPLKAVEVMRSTLEYAEASEFDNKRASHQYMWEITQEVERHGACAVLVHSHDIERIALLSKERCPVPIIVLCTSEAVARAMVLRYGVFGIVGPLRGGDIIARGLGMSGDVVLALADTGYTGIALENTQETS